jgi:hypothetical protein
MKATSAFVIASVYALIVFLNLSALVVIASPFDLTSSSASTSASARATKPGTSSRVP